MFYGFIKQYYLLGLYEVDDTKDDLQVFVKVGWIDEKQKQEIIASKTTTE